MSEQVFLHGIDMQSAHELLEGLAATQAAQTKLFAPFKEFEHMQQHGESMNALFNVFQRIDDARHTLVRAMAGDSA